MRRDRGAAAVEFAMLVLPLTLLTFGIVYFGFAFFVQTTLDNAARDAIWYYTLAESDPAGAAYSAANHALGPLGGNALGSGIASMTITPGGAGCTGTEIATATISYLPSLPLDGVFGWELSLEGSGSMRCNE